jgi:glycosyltransferase involved in cell wall biosynthesis
MKVCLVALNMYPMLTADYGSPKIGGAELQQINIAKSLVAQGHDVSIVCLDHGQADGAKIGGLTVIKTFREDAGIPVFRFLHPRLTSIWSALFRADCDIYYCRAASFITGILRFFRLASGKKYVFASALDTDFMPKITSVPNFRDRLLYRFGLRGADRVLVQSDRQRVLLTTNYGLDAAVVPNFLLEPRKSLAPDARRIILWVSTIRNRKRPLLFVRLAERFPKERFVMVGGRLPSHAALYDEVCAASRDTPNLQFLGFQPYEDVEALFDECKIFVNTSLYEGFPNTYLQAWRREIPVISFFDPDDVIRDNSLGRIVEDEDQLVMALDGLRGSYDRYQHVGDYYAAHHSSAVGEQLGRLLEDLVE